MATKSRSRTAKYQAWVDSDQEALVTEFHVEILRDDVLLGRGVLIRRSLIRPALLPLPELVRVVGADDTLAHELCALVEQRARNRPAAERWRPEPVVLRFSDGETVTVRLGPPFLNETSFEETAYLAEQITT